jgi:AraC family transcriptional regulator of adaptative response/methylated-DNA-[protein]-cysteine methyltransferase
MSDYQRIASAIEYIRSHLQEQPTLEQIAGHVHLSPCHFQRMFSRGAGVTPKRFLQVLTLEHARPLLDQAMPLLAISAELGLSSASRLYDHFVTLQAVTPGEYKTRGAGLTIEYSFQPGPFGDVFIAMTERGLCKLAFVEPQDRQQALADLREQWPAANLQANDARATELLGRIFHPQRKFDRPLSLLVSGSNFQVNVWQALLQIPAGQVTSYGRIADALGHPRAARAVANAVAANPIALLIPCHRVIRNNGDITGYRWGSTRKHAILAWEAAQTEDLANTDH